MPYRVAPIFLIRLAGAPFGRVECLATAETLETARALAGTGRPLADETKIEATLMRELENARR